MHIVEPLSYDHGEELYVFKLTATGILDVSKALIPYPYVSLTESTIIKRCFKVYYFRENAILCSLISPLTDTQFIWKY